MYSALNVRQLRQLCKHKKIKYSNLRKTKLIESLSFHHSSIKIQRFFRGKWILNDCPISMERVKYPCFAYRPKGWDVSKKRNHYFIYYNLKPLVEFMLVSGDFRDPKTRETYSEDTLRKIDTYAKKVGFKLKNLLTASRNRNYYKRKRDRENDIIVLERCLDEVTSSIRFLMENESLSNPNISLNSFLFPVFHKYFKNLVILSKENARHLLSRTVLSVLGNDRQVPPDPNRIKDYILQFLYTMESTYLLEN